MKKSVTITLTLDLDEQQLGKPINIWLYQFINRLNYEIPVRGIEFNGQKRTFAKTDDVKNIGLREKEDL